MMLGWCNHQDINSGASAFINTFWLTFYRNMHILGCSVFQWSTDNNFRPFQIGSITAVKTRIHSISAQLIPDCPNLLPTFSFSRQESRRVISLHWQRGGSSLTAKGGWMFSSCLFSHHTGAYLCLEVVMFSIILLWISMYMVMTLYEKFAENMYLEIVFISFSIICRIIRRT